MDSYTEQEAISPWKWKSVSTDADTGIVVRAIGSSASYTVEVDAGGEITFKKGALGAEVVDTNVGASGVIDTNNALYNTFGKLADYLNSLDDYEAYLVDVLRADSTDDTLLIKSATQIKTTAGAPLYKDTSVALNVSVAVSAEDFRYKNDGAKNEMSAYRGTPTGTGADYFKIYEDETLIHTITGPGTGVEAYKDANQFGHGVVGKKLLFRLSMATTMTAGVLSVLSRSTKLVPSHKTPIS